MKTIEVDLEEYDYLLERNRECTYLENLLDFLDDMIPNLKEVIQQYDGE